ncbi:hypothetical protein [Ferrimonas senticii]|uniref:hypothetical protein n=1 Tax=Ferrimonas senticii TaxID=394566 RepID=UPI000418C262|nr:hypothetical protein [Ferrimonas senticii]
MYMGPDRRQRQWQCQPESAISWQPLIDRRRGQGKPLQQLRKQSQAAKPESPQSWGSYYL